MCIYQVHETEAAAETDRAFKDVRFPLDHARVPSRKADNVSSLHAQWRSDLYTPR